MHTILKDLTWRYATKKFDPNRKIKEEDLEVIKESLRLVPSSYGLQPLTYVFVENTEIREQLMNASFGQRQVVDASHLLVICAYTSLSNEDIDAYFDNVIQTRDLKEEDITGYKNFMKNSVGKLNDEETKIWNSKQAYIALGQVLHTCASMRIDATPMEGFSAEEYSSILQLEEKSLHPILVCPMGYRDPTDSTQFQEKVRKEHEVLFKTI